MSLDPSIILQAGQGQQAQNPLTTAGQVIGLQNQLIQNRGNQQMLAARQAIGPIYQQSIDPDTGQLDTNKLLAAASQDPRTAWMAGDLVKSAQDRQQQQVQIQQSQFDLAQKHLQTAMGMLAPLVTNKNATRQDYVNTISDAVSQGLITPQEAASEIGSMPNNDADLGAWGMAHYTRYQSMDNQIKALRGNVQTDSLGSRTNITQVNPLTGSVTPLASAQNGLSPSDAASTVPYVDPQTGQPMTMSKGEYAGAQPQGAFQAPGVSQPAVTPSTPPQAGAQPPAAPQAPAAPTQPATTPPHLPTALAPGQPEALQDSAAQGQAALKGSADYRNNVRPLIAEAQNQLSQGVLTGPSADTTKLAGQFAAQFGIDVPNTSKAEVLGKVLEQIAQRQTGVLGGTPTDAKLASAQSASPNTHLSNQGLSATLATVEGQGQAIDLLGQSYNAYLNSHPSSPVPFNQFRVQFSKDIDPYVLTLRSMPAADRQAAFSAMTPKQRADVQTSSDKLDKLAPAIGWQP